MSGGKESVAERECCKMSGTDGGVCRTDTIITMLTRKKMAFFVTKEIATIHSNAALLRIGLPLSSIFGVGTYSFEYLNEYSRARLNRKICSTAARARSPPIVVGPDPRNWQFVTQCCKQDFFSRPRPFCDVYSINRCGCNSVGRPTYIFI